MITLKLITHPQALNDSRFAMSNSFLPHTNWTVGTCGVPMCLFLYVHHHDNVKLTFSVETREPRVAESTWMHQMRPPNDALWTSKKSGGQYSMRNRINGSSRSLTDLLFCGGDSPGSGWSTASRFQVHHECCDSNHLHCTIAANAIPIFAIRGPSWVSMANPTNRVTGL